MIWLFVSLAMIAFATAGRFIHARAVDAEVAAQRRRLMDHLRLAETGLTFTGSVTGNFEMRGTVHGVEVWLKSATALKLPGSSAERRPCCVVELDAAIPELLVCCTSDVDAVMGPIPSVPRTRTGQTAFDASYALFIAPADEQVATGFRTSQAADALAWAKPEMVQQLLASGMFWLRARAGRCELALPIVGAEEAYSALTLATNVARAAAGRSVVDLPPNQLCEKRIEELPPLWIIAVVACVAGAFPGALICALPWGFDDNSWRAFIPAFVLIVLVYCFWVGLSVVKWLRRDSKQRGLKER